MKKKLSKAARKPYRKVQHKKKGSQPPSLVIDGKKHCSVCKEMVAANMFYKDKRAVSGLECMCIFCKKKWHRERAISGAGNAYSRAYRSNNRDIVKKKNDKYSKANAAKIKAHRILNNSVNSLKIDKKPCIICKQKAVAHHDDYTKPLDVTWLCEIHHRAWHRVFIAEGI